MRNPHLEQLRPQERAIAEDMVWRQGCECAKPESLHHDGHRSEASSAEGSGGDFFFQSQKGCPRGGGAGGYSRRQARLNVAEVIRARSLPPPVPSLTRRLLGR